jgi:hypothetical protein
VPKPTPLILCSCSLNFIPEVKDEFSLHDVFETNVVAVRPGIKEVRSLASSIVVPVIFN